MYFAARTYKAWSQLVNIFFFISTRQKICWEERRTWRKPRKLSSRTIPVFQNQNVWVRCGMLGLWLCFSMLSAQRLVLCSVVLASAGGHCWVLVPKHHFIFLVTGIFQYTDFPTHPMAIWTILIHASGYFVSVSAGRGRISVWINSALAGYCSGEWWNTADQRT